MITFQNQNNLKNFQIKKTQVFMSQVQLLKCLQVVVKTMKNHFNLIEVV